MPDPDPTLLYGATVAGVRGHLQDLTIDDNSNPSAAEVGEFLEEGEGRTAVRIGTLEGEDPHVVAAGRGLVHLYGAALTAEAAYPEQDRSGVFWERWREGVDELLLDLGGPRPAPALAAASAAISAPDPMFRRDEEW